MPVHLYHYPKCSTCRKARAFLDRHGVAYTHSDFVAEPIPRARLADLLKRSGLPIRRFFNTSGESYRNGNFKDRIERLDESQLLAELAKDGKLVKRPILDAGKVVLVGFDAELYAKTLAAR